MRTSTIEGSPDRWGLFSITRPVVCNNAGCNSNRFGLSRKMHRPILNQNNSMPNEIEPTVSECVRHHLLRGQQWKLGLKEHSSIKLDLANQCLGTSTTIQETERWMDRLKVDNPRLVRLLRA